MSETFNFIGLIRWCPPKNWNKSYPPTWQRRPETTITYFPPKPTEETKEEEKQSSRAQDDDDDYITNDDDDYIQNKDDMDGYELQRVLQEYQFMLNYEVAYDIKIKQGWSVVVGTEEERGFCTFLVFIYEVIRTGCIYGFFSWQQEGCKLGIIMFVDPIIVQVIFTHLSKCNCFFGVEEIEQMILTEGRKLKEGRKPIILSDESIFRAVQIFHHFGKVQEPQDQIMLMNRTKLKKSCWYCHATMPGQKLKWCTGCPRNALYCSKKCQKRAWIKYHHKASCPNLRLDYTKYYLVEDDPQYQQCEQNFHNPDNKNDNN